MRKIAIITVMLFSVGCLYEQVLYAQEDQREASSPIFFAAPVVETVWYGRVAPSIGFGVALGTEGKISIGLKTIYATPLTEDDLTTLEITLFFRFYLTAADTVTVYPRGLFAQITYGTAIFSRGGEISFPARGGAISIGVTAGWRFPLGSRFFVEPYIRAGYPYYGGAGLSAGVRF